MTETELAEALGIQQPAVSKLIKRGMPTSSVDAARSWREANVHRPGPKSAEMEENLNDGFELPEIIISQEDDPYATVERLSLAERTIDGELVAWKRLEEELVRQRDNAVAKSAIDTAEKRLTAAREKIHALRNEQRNAIKALQEANLRLLKMEELRGKLISIDAAKELVSRALAGIVSWIKKLPDQAKSEEERVRLSTIGESGLLIANSSAEEVMKTDWGYGS